MTFTDEDEYSKYLLDLLTKLERQREEAAMDSLMRSKPEMEVIGPRAKYEDSAFSSASMAPGTDKEEKYNYAMKIDKGVYTKVNQVMPKWFTKLDNQSRRVVSKLNKPIRKAQKLEKKVRKKLKKALGF